jgi:hypothetical protein
MRRTSGELPTQLTSPKDVNMALTVHGRTRPRVENTDYAAFSRRVLRAQGRRIAAGDVDGLADLIALEHDLTEAIQTAVAGLRAHGYSWTEIATRLGVTRQGAQQRWGDSS